MLLKNSKDFVLSAVFKLRNAHVCCITSSFHTCGCLKSSWKKKITKRLAKLENVNQYASPNTRRTERVYGWGLTLYGALGNTIVLFLMFCL